MTTIKARFVADIGLDNNGNSITNAGTIGSSLTLSGANDLILTTTGPTNVVFPLSGTLATTTSSISGNATSATNIAGGAGTQIPFQASAGITEFSSDLTYNSSNQQFMVATASTATYPVIIGGSNSISQPIGTSSSLLLRAATGNNMRFYTDPGLGTARGGSFIFSGGSSALGAGANIQLSPGLSGTPGLSGFIKHVGATGYLQGGGSNTGISGAVVLDFAANGLYYDYIMTGNISFSFINPIDSLYWIGLTVRLSSQNSAYTVSWPTEVNWATGAAPIIPITGYTTIHMVSTDGGTTYLGSVVGDSTVANDTITNATYYPTLATNTAGASTVKVSSTKLSFNPSTGVLAATEFNGSGALLTNIPNSALTNSSITINGTSITLGGSGSISAPLNQVVIGTGNDLASDAGLTYIPASQTLTVGTTSTGSSLISALPGQSLDISSSVSITLTTNNVDRLIIGTNGEFSVNGSAGATGQVLTSSGTGGTPTWQNIGAGSVTSVAGTGTVSGLTLSGTVTSSGNLTLGGTLSLTSTDVTAALGFTPINKAGDTMTGALILNADPVVLLGAATKQYVDTIASGVNVHAACETGTVSALASCTYNNGTSGVGATLTATANASINTAGIGGYTALSTGSRVLIKDQVLQIQNGIYNITDLGSASTPWILTRSSDFDGAPTTEIVAGDLTYVQKGTLAGTQWVETNIGTGHIAGPPAYDYVIPGTDAVIFSQFSGAGSYTAGTGINIASNAISNTGVLSNIAGTGISVSGATGNVTIANTGVLSIAGTTNQIIASASTGAITLSLPQSIDSSAAPTFAGTNFTGIPNSALTNSSITINGTVIALGGTGTITAPAAASTLTGTTLASNVVNSSLTSVGTITTGVWNGTAIASANIANTAVANLSGTNTGDNAANSTYANDYRAANFVAGTNYLTPTGSAAGLTGLTSTQVTTALGYTPGSGTGTVTSVAGTGTVSGLTLTGTVTTTGSLTLGGTLSLTSTDVTTALGFTPYDATNPAGYATAAVTLTTAAQPNITSVGTLSALTVTATITGSVSGNAGTATTANATNTANNFQMNSLGVGTAGSGTAGEIRATNNVTAYYSDDRLKTRTGKIEDALDKVATLDAFYYYANETAQALGYKPIPEVGISAQQVQAIMPEVVAPAPIDDKYLTVRYERLVPLLIAAIQELQAEVAALKIR